jgi:hypothetical protein
MLEHQPRGDDISRRLPVFNGLLSLAQHDTFAAIP